MLRKLADRMKEFRLTMRMKLTLSLSAIAVTLLVSSVISIMEYYRMSDYVSDLIADNIRSVNVAQKLSAVTNKYNLDLACDNCVIRVLKISDVKLDDEEYIVATRSTLFRTSTRRSSWGIATRFATP